MAEWDIETITLRAARDYADQFHFQRGAGDDAEAYEADLARAKRDIAKALAEHDREVWERRGAHDVAAVEKWIGPGKTSERAVAAIRDVNWRDFDAPASGGHRDGSEP